MSDPAADEATYDAFISYRRADGREAAAWLRRALQSYRPPKSLGALRGRRLRVYLDTVYERGTVDFYEQSIRPALAASRFLIVIATPAAVERRDADDWIYREVEDFCEGGREHQVITVRARGELSGPLPGRLEERFPNMEIVDLRSLGRFSRWLPAVSRKLDEEKLKIVAPLLGVDARDMPLLRLEEERRRQAALGFWAGAVVTAVVAMAAFAVVGFQGMNRAQRALEDSTFATEKIVTSVADAFSDLETLSEKRSFPLIQACSLLGKLSHEAGHPPDIEVATTCGIERARGLEVQTDYPAARAELEQVMADARARPDIKGARALIHVTKESVGERLRRGDTAHAVEDLARLSMDISALDRSLGQTSEFQILSGDALRWASTVQGDLKQPLALRLETVAEADRRLESAGRSADLDDLARLRVALTRGEVMLSHAALSHSAGNEAAAREIAQAALHLQDDLRAKAAEQDRDVWMQSVLGRVRTARFLVATFNGPDLAGEAPAMERIIADVNVARSRDDLSVAEKQQLAEAARWLAFLAVS